MKKEIYSLLTNEFVDYRNADEETKRRIRESVSKVVSNIDTASRRQTTSKRNMLVQK